MKIALITGITGQDGSYLAEELLVQGWEVYGLMRRASVFTTERIEHIFDHPKLHLRHGDMTDIAGMTHLLCEIRDATPSKLYIFNLAAQSHVGVSFETPLYTTQVDAIGPLNLLEAVRTTGLTDIARIYQASTSELYGKVQEVPQTETTPFYPRSPYGVAKLYAFWIMKNYREAYGMHTCNGILHNHESERRGKTFVTRKITLAVARIKQALDVGAPFDPLALGNMDARRDWGHARDYVRGMIAILNKDEPDDYVLATGETHSVREFVEKAFAVVGITITWINKGLKEKGYWFIDGKRILIVKVDERYFRPAEVDKLLGNAMKAKNDLGWEPEITFDELVETMVNADLQE
jgi:GDPmannose 4,6-dehydratase